MVGDEDAYVPVLEFPHDILNVLNSNGVHASERLIEHDELGVYGQAARYLGTAAFTTGELRALVLAHLLQAKLIYQILQFLLLVVAWLTRHLQDGSNVVLHAHGAEHRSLLSPIAYAATCTFVDRIRGDVRVV